MKLRAFRPRLRSSLITVAALLLGACATTPRPGFYREDGPPKHVPADLLSAPDAVPRDEPLNPNANRPYVALGRTYVPDTSGAPFRQRGIASWYGRQFQGNRTASGEAYDMFAMTAAHPTLPIPSYARVTTLGDGRSVIVRINDRGPFLHDRIIDLSYAAAARLGLTGPGSGEVEVERIVVGQGAPSVALRASEGKRASEGVGNSSGEVAAADAPVAVALAVAPSGAESASSVPLPSPMAARSDQPLPAETRGVAASGAKDGSAREGVADADVPPAATGPRWSIQLGAFKIATNAEALRDRLALLLGSPDASGLPAELRSPRIERQNGLSRVLIGQASERAVALRWSRLLERFLQRPTALFLQ